MRNAMNAAEKEKTDRGYLGSKLSKEKGFLH